MDITDDEVAKYHIRHMVGGHALRLLPMSGSIALSSRSARGLLLNFLKKLGKRFNILLFHYRNHGAAYGRVLVGLQISDDKREQLQDILKNSAIVTGMGQTIRLISAFCVNTPVS